MALRRPIVLRTSNRRLPTRKKAGIPALCCLHCTVFPLISQFPVRILFTCLTFRLTRVFVHSRKRKRERAKEKRSADIDWSWMRNHMVYACGYTRSRCIVLGVLQGNRVFAAGAIPLARVLFRQTATPGRIKLYAEFLLLSYKHTMFCSTTPDSHVQTFVGGKGNRSHR